VVHRPANTTEEKRRAFSDQGEKTRENGGRKKEENQRTKVKENMGSKRGLCRFKVERQQKLGTRVSAIFNT